MAAAVQVFNFQWLARPAARSLFQLFTYSSRRRLFINQTFYEQLSPLSSLVGYPKRVFPKHGWGPILYRPCRTTWQNRKLARFTR